MAAQARQHGLGLLFATQEPMSIENGIVSNCSRCSAQVLRSRAAASEAT